MIEIDLTNVKKEKIENHTSKGNQPKWHIADKWYKADHMGYEALSEYVVSELLKKSNVNDFVRYDIIKINHDNKDSLGCMCIDFKKNNEMLVPLEKLHRQYFGIGLADALAKKETVKDKISYAVKFVEEVTGLKQVGEYFTVMLTIDAFFLNEDRHTNNIAVLRDEKSQDYRFAPIFDNGLALLADTNDYPLEDDIYKNIKRVMAKPFDRNFDQQLDAAEELYGTHLKFYFTQTDVYRITDELKSIYDEKLVCRVEKILLGQMRKYQYLF